MHWTQEVLAEMARARAKFPDPQLLLTAFTEEAGEVVKAVLDHYAGKGDLADVRKELIQTAAMVGRLLEEGDPIHGLPPSDPASAFQGSEPAAGSDATESALVGDRDGRPGEYRTETLAQLANQARAQV